MKINHNMSAVIANNNLSKNEDSLNIALERLSSGLRINHAQDDPAGTAIGIKMHTQIDGMNQAVRNANDGISVVETADGALEEVSAMLQRMRELCVQGANGTNTEDDLEAIQDEIDALTEEIDRISRDTEFNTVTLFDGSLDTRVYTDSSSVKCADISEGAKTGNYTLAIASSSGGISDIKLVDGFSASANVSWDDEGVIKITDMDGFEMELWMLDDSNRALYVEATQEDKDEGEDLYTVNATGEYEKIAADDVEEDAATGKLVATADGTTPVYKLNGINIEVTDMGTMTLQVGANEHQTVEIKIPEVSSTSLRIDDLQVTTNELSGEGITKLDDAIHKVSRVRAQIGAMENRLSHASASLSTTVENLTAAVSRIEDVDMAEEMTEYTSQTVLVQAATSVLSQANELPEQALQLLK
jgi:flagellin